MNEMLKELIFEKIDRMGDKIPLEKGASMGSLSAQQKQMFQNILNEVMKELSPSFKGGIVLVVQVLMKVLVNHIPKDKN